MMNVRLPQFPPEELDAYIIAHKQGAHGRCVVCALAVRYDEGWDDGYEEGIKAGEEAARENGPDDSYYDRD
mgnify:CR=1 FL=1